MGSEILQAVIKEKTISISSGISSHFDTLADIGGDEIDFPCYRQLDDALKHTDADVYIDFTHAAQAYENIRSALSKGLHVVSGTTGITESVYHELSNLALSQHKSLIYSPNYSIGAMIMLRAAKLAAKHMEDFEIIELHHPNKADSPSGTAIHTAGIIAESKLEFGQKPVENKDLSLQLASMVSNLDSSRGLDVFGVHIHSIRLPGLLAHQEIIFGGCDETLTIRHDTMSRRCFIPGILLAIQKATVSEGLIYGLDALSDIAI